MVGKVDIVKETLCITILTLTHLALLENTSKTYLF